MKKGMPDFWELGSIDVCVNYKDLHVGIMDYVEAKTKDLKEFGYGSLTEDEVLKSTWRVYSNQIQKQNIIDQFIKQDFHENKK